MYGKSLHKNQLTRQWLVWRPEESILKETYWYKVSQLSICEYDSLKSWFDAKETSAYSESSA